MKTPRLLLVAAWWTCIAGSGSAQVLFSDSFDRADSRNIDATLDGITDNTGSNLAAGGVYSLPHLDPNNAAPTFGEPDADAANGGGARIIGNALQLATGPGTSNAAINHNFINPEILAAGGFSVSLDVTAYPNTLFEYGGAFAIGMSQTEIATAGDAITGTSRMTGAFGQGIGAAVPTAALADFWIAVRGNNTLAWGSNTGLVQGVTGLGTRTGTIRVKFEVPDFNLGSTVNYEVFFNGVSRGIGSFVWSGTDENYIGIDSRDGTGVTFDNLEIKTLSTEILMSAAPLTVSSFGASETVLLDWSVDGDLPSGATYRILNGDLALIDSGSAATGSGFFETQIDGREGDETFTIELLDTSLSLVATTTATVIATAPQIDVTQSAVRLDANGPAGLVTILYDGSLFPADGSYEITDDNAAAVEYLIPTTGALEPPLYFDMNVDPAQGSVTFTVVFKDVDGTVFDTREFTVAAAASAPAVSTVLFADDYSRYADSPDPFDIDSSTTGMSGSLAPLDYLEVYEANDQSAEGLPKPDSIQISTFDSLQVASGPGMSCWALDHNFIDSQIAADGTLSISAVTYSIVQDPPDDMPDRYFGFGMGMSADEVALMGDEAGTANIGPRGSVAVNVSRGMSDFHVSVAATDMVQVFANGILVADFPVDGDGIFGNGGVEPSGVALRADIAFEDPVNLAAGTFAFYKVYCDGLLVTSGYFKLTHSAANYVVFSGRAMSHVEMDDLVIGTVSSADLAYPGNPADDLPAVAIGNAVTAGGVVTGFDLAVGGAPGVFYELQKSPDLAGFTGWGTPGDGVGGYPSATISGAADGSGELLFPNVAPRAGAGTTGFIRAVSFHWPAP
ncbi:hypothetical protein [Haloferula sargassicola]|uniref:Uncharacterized protein n=1 Tax=Haloferula sargassicola TaxID=490096 RepID=A0ABP9UUR6_9BACT